MKTQMVMKINMLYLYTELSHINYTTILSRLRQERGSDTASRIMQSKLAINPVTLKVFKQAKFVLKSLVSGFAENYGASLAVLEISDYPIITNKTGGDSMLSVSATIKDIDYGKLAEAIRESASKSGSTGKNTTMLEVISIIEPFIADTMETIPPSALVQLINLLAKDKLIDLAEDYGINLSEISVTSE